MPVHISNYPRPFQRLLAPRMIAIMLIGLFAASVVGCSGGSMSTSDIRKYAIRRSSGDDQEQQKPPKPASNPAPADASAATAGQTADAADNAATTIAAVEQGPRASQSADAKTKEDDHDVASTEGASASEPDDVAGAVASVSDTKSPPQQPLSPAERATISAENMLRIAEALEAYRQDRGAYPSRSITDRSGGELLSWRVQLLPYLGYEKLYKQFQTTQPWFSAANKQLLEKIPSVYQSPERFDVNTNYLGVSGGSTVFASTKPLLPALIEDGPEHTAFVVEADDELAVPWTQPQEYVFSRDNPVEGLGGLRDGRFFVVWGGGQAGAVPLSTTHANLIAMYTSDAGESFSSYSVSMPLDDDLFASLGGAAAPVISPPADDLGGGPAREATSRESPGGGAANNVSPASTSPLVSEYASAAQTAFQAGEVGAALRWFYASHIFQPAHSPWHSVYQWAPGLRRPASTIHFCIGVRGDSAASVRGARMNRRTASASRYRDATRQAVGEPGVELLELVEEHAGGLIPSSLASAATGASASSARRSKDVPPIPVSYIGIGTRADLMTRASEAACDVLVLIEVEGDSRRGGGRSVQFDFYDFAGERRLLALPPLNWIDTAAGVAALRRDDSYRTAKFQLEDLLVDQLSFTDWPTAVTAEAAASRVLSLSEQRAMNILEAVAEMNVYRARGLVSDRQMLIGLRRLLEDDAAEIVLLGRERDQRRVLREWLPVEDPEQLAQRTVQRSRDDDD